MIARGLRIPSLALVLVASACTESNEGDIDGRGGPPSRDEDLFRDMKAPMVADVRPPPLSGGTLLITSSGVAVAADPERDRLVLAALPNGSPQEIALSPGDQPGRATEDDLGRVHVVLRRGGAVVTVDPATGEVLARRSVCAAPRGIAHDGTRQVLHVACAGGELVRLSVTDLAAPILATQILEPDLRDVVAIGDRLLVSKLRGATVMSIDPDGAITTRTQPKASEISDFDGNMLEYGPGTGWRMIPAGDDGAILIHGMSQRTPIDMETEDSPYGTSGEPSPVRTEVSFVGAAGIARQVHQPELDRSTLTIDVARSADGTRVALLDAVQGQIFEYDPAFMGGGALSLTFVTGAVGIAYAPDGTLVVQTRQVPSLALIQGGAVVATVELGGASRLDTGYDLFHGLDTALAASGLACASCHPEGQEDGHVWSFTDVGARRTQSLAGTLTGTAPFHWQGDLESLDDLMDEVMARRMGAMAQGPERVEALRTWLEAIVPVRPAPAMVQAAGDANRGRALFESNETLCATCHGGPSLTNNETVYVGTSIGVQVPSLVGLGMRAPFMHDGCAPTLFERFDPICGGGELHGFTAHLGEADIADLVAYMLTL